MAEEGLERSHVAPLAAGCFGSSAGVIAASQGSAWPRARRASGISIRLSKLSAHAILGRASDGKRSLISVGARLRRLRLRERPDVGGVHHFPLATHIVPASFSVVPAW